MNAMAAVRRDARMVVGGEDHSSGCTHGTVRTTMDHVMHKSSSELQPLYIVLDC